MWPDLEAQEFVGLLAQGLVGFLAEGLVGFCGLILGQAQVLTFCLVLGFFLTIVLVRISMAVMKHHD